MPTWLRAASVLLGWAAVAPVAQALEPPAADGSSSVGTTASAGGSQGDAARQQARALGYSGVKAYAAGHYVAASEQLERSFGLLPVPSLGLWSARALSKRRLLLEAERRYREVAMMHVEADAPEVQHAAQETAKAELLELLPRIPTVRIQVHGARPEQVGITLDGAPLPVERWARGEPVNPGRHRLVGTYLAEQSALEFTASEARESEVMLRFAPNAAAPVAAALSPAVETASASSRPWRIGGWIAVGTGVASLAASGVSYFVARNEYDAMKDEGLCEGNTCQPSERLDRYETFQTFQTVSLIAGLVLGGAGATILILEPRLSEPRAQGTLGVRIGAGSAALYGQF
jgi:hypothetical protein